MELPPELLVGLGTLLVSGGTSWGIVRARTSRIEALEEELKEKRERLARLETEVSNLKERLVDGLNQVNSQLVQLRSEVHQARVDINASIDRLLAALGAREAD